MAADFVFAYGSNMNRSDLRSWLESDGQDSSLIVGVYPAKIEGYDFVWDYYSQGKAGGTANLEHKEGSTIWGVLIEMEDDLLKAFDRKEGHPYFYSRGESRVPVTRVEDGKTFLAWLYVARANKGGRRDVKPTREYKKIVLEGAVFWGFPESYIEKIRAWATK
ncbi:MAG: gamma-glutamylcyclotransferase [Desulfomonile tiedjei]|uniref:Gamma-glutamylcyclotransferase n=1 Tax=Desulfomonile tiedjei TaxID=2358 RepID=A0A9D6Z7U8_9BACT|nr:gamma-glutamylcyclotransferase [Desulfomonile tiedjei]